MSPGDTSMNAITTGSNGVPGTVDYGSCAPPLPQIAGYCKANRSPYILRLPGRVESVTCTSGTRWRHKRVGLAAPHPLAWESRSKGLPDAMFQIWRTPRRAEGR